MVLRRRTHHPPPASPPQPMQPAGSFYGATAVPSLPTFQTFFPVCFNRLGGGLRWCPKSSLLFSSRHKFYQDTPPGVTLQRMKSSQHPGNTNIYGFLTPLSISIYLPFLFGVGFSCYPTILQTHPTPKTLQSLNPQPSPPMPSTFLPVVSVHLLPCPPPRLGPTSPPGTLLRPLRPPLPSPPEPHTATPPLSEWRTEAGRH